jgi:hypothetical protein
MEREGDERRSTFPLLSALVSWEVNDSESINGSSIEVIEERNINFLACRRGREREAGRGAEREREGGAGRQIGQRGGRRMAPA